MPIRRDKTTFIVQAEIRSAAILSFKGVCHTHSFNEAIMAFIARTVCAAALLIASASASAEPHLTPQECNDYPFVKPTAPVTHRQLAQELIELEAVGYDPADVGNVEYPRQIDAAEERLWKEYARDCTAPSSMAATGARD
jgi:hypothetical protein